jgi:hypothetical protein
MNNLSQTTPDELYRVKVANQCGVYANAALGAVWVQLTAVDFSNLGALTGGAVAACTAGQDFTELTIWNDSVNTVYFVLRANAVGEVPATSAFPVPAGGVVIKECSLINAGAGVTTVSIIASGAGSSMRLAANFATR